MTLTVLPRIGFAIPRLRVQTASAVRAGTLAMSIAALVFVLRFGTNTPVVDEWDLTHVVLGGMTLSEWTFTRLNEHYFIPANAAFWILHTLTHLDFRAGMIANWLVLTAASVMFQKAAQRMRGGVSMADLIFPAALLHFGHAYNALMSFQLAFGFFVLGIAWLAKIVSEAEIGNEGTTAVKAALALLFVMLNGGMGIAFVPPVGIWILVLAWRSKSILALVPVAIAVAYSAFALFGLPKVSAAPSEPLGWGRTAWCVVQYLGVGTGLWYDGPHWPRNGILITAGYGVVLTLAAITVFKRQDGGRSFGWFVLLGGHFAVALGIAVSRGGCLAERYVTISAVGIVLVALALIHWQAKNGASIPRMSYLAVLAFVLFVGNIPAGFDYGHRHRNLDRSLRRDIAAGMPIGFLKDKYAVLLRVGDNLEAALLRLKEHHIRDFAHVVPTPLLRETTAVLHADDTLESPTGHVAGLLVELENETPLNWAEVKVQWQGVAEAPTANVYPPRTPGRHMVRLWVNDTPQQPRLSMTPGLKVVRVGWLTE